MQLDFYRDDKIYGRLDKMNDPLKRLDDIMNWQPFVEVIDAVRPNRTGEKTGGRPPIGNLIMLKGLLIGLIYNLSDAQLEFQITDRITFMRFCGLEIGDASPDANSFWLLREKLKETGKYDELFQVLLDELAKVGLEYSKCAVVDATFIDAPRGRKIKKAQYEALKAGVMPFELDLAQHEQQEAHLPENEREMCHRNRQIDTDARWAYKGNELHYGYKNHVAVDAETKLIVAHTVSAASVHDSQKLVEVVPEGTKRVYDDSAYAGAAIDAQLQEKCPGVEHKTCKKGRRNAPLTPEQKEYNAEVVSRVRSRVEHVFGRMTTCMGGLNIRTIGQARATCVCALRDFAHNMLRYETLFRQGKCEKMAI
jgi:IS5 family transposase